MKRKELRKYLDIIEVIRDDLKVEKQESVMQKFWDLGDLIDGTITESPKDTMKLYIELESKFMSLFDEIKEEYFNYGLKISSIVDVE